MNLNAQNKFDFNQLRQTVIGFEQEAETFFQTELVMGDLQFSDNEAMIRKSTPMTVGQQAEGKKGFFDKLWSKMTGDTPVPKPPPKTAQSSQSQIYTGEKAELRAKYESLVPDLRAYGLTS